MQKIDNDALPVAPSTAAPQSGAEGGASLPNESRSPYTQPYYPRRPYDAGESFSIGLHLI